MFITHFAKRSLTTKVDAQCIPLKPTWSVQSLLEPMGEPISDKQFQHLLTLSRLGVTNQEQASKLKSEIDQLTQFTEHIKTVDFKGEKPLTHIWKEDVGQVLRSDELVESSSSRDEVRGRDLLKYAKEKSGNFYVVKGTMPSSSD
ncbi:hypothetical protein EDC94DRAFT_72993 [Helicostylum pulchrum]|nr:hypothetical protein EDC94DRAFT_72993 [Helicostylum pulchrum]